MESVITELHPDDPPADALAESWMSIKGDLITDADRSREIETNPPNEFS